MASNVEEEVKQYASAGREESSEEQGEPTALYNVSTALQKNALEAMDMLQLEIQSVKEENEIFKEFFSKIMECGGDEYRQIIERRGLNLLQHKVQEIINPVGKAEREYGRGTTINSNHTCELQDEVAFYMSQCCEQREELIQVKEKLKLFEEENEDLQAEVGRQLFLRSKERRLRNICQPPSKYASGKSKPGRATGAWYSSSCTDVKLPDGAGLMEESGFSIQQRLQEISLSLSELELSRMKKLVQPILDGFRLARIRECPELFEELERRGEFSCSFVRDLLERIHRFDLVEKLVEPFHNGEESSRREYCSPQESKQLDDMSESVSGVNSKQCDEVEEGEEIFDNTEVDEEHKVCNNSNMNSFNSDSEGAAVTFHTENANGSNFFGDVDLSEERYDSASSLSQSFDVPSIGLESREKSWSPSSTGEQSESEKLKGACAENGKRDKEVTHDFSFPDGAETQFYSNHHLNDTVDGADNLPERAQDSLKQEDLTIVNQDSLPYGDSPHRQNVSGARFTAQKDTATDQSDSHVSNQSKKWEHLGARPRDRPPKIDRCPEPSLLNSLEDLAPQQGAGPVAHGVANTFLERHSEDKHLHESLYYTNAEKMLTENSSLQGASHLDSVINLTESNKAQLYFGECQVPFRPDPYSQTYVSLFPQTSGAFIGGNNSSNHVTELVEFPSNCLYEGEQHADEDCALVKTVPREREEREQSGQERQEHEFQAERAPQRQRDEREPQVAFRGQECQEALGRPIMCQEERYIGMPTTFVVDALDSTHNNAQAFVQGVRDASRRISAGNPQFRRCSVQEHYDQDASPAICTTCHRYRHLGPCRVGVQSCHDECCICQMDMSSGLHILQCSHRVHVECIVWLIQHNTLNCPSCFGAFFPSS